MTEFASFSFNTVPQIVTELGCAARLGSIIGARFPAARHAVVVTDQGVIRAGLLDLVLAGLRRQSIEASVYDRVVADPPEAIVLAAAAFARECGADIVIGFGGGSSMDAAKLVAILALGEQQLAGIYGIGNVKGGRLPLVQVPTTAGTGSEVTNIAIVTTGETTKTGVVAPQLYADIAILDAELTVGLPSRVTAATGIDAMVHAIEAYTSRQRKNPMSDVLARQALMLLSANILPACVDGENLAARQAMLVGAMMAGQAFSNAPVAAVHALAYPIGGIFHVPHGLSNSLVLPHVLRFNLPSATPAYAELCGMVQPGVNGTEGERAKGLIVAMQQIAEGTGIETRLSQLAIAERDLDRLADDAMLQTRLLGNNPRELTREDARAIYAAAL
ncbi:MAG TPA: iron-containing alcohol dehydrogenase [Telluria sp.]|nr:iron-containing alcohol dehydrogenase [Telluria sp.]